MDSYFNRYKNKGNHSKTWKNNLTFDLLDTDKSIKGKTKINQNKRNIARSIW